MHEHTRTARGSGSGHPALTQWGQVLPRFIDMAAQLNPTLPKVSLGLGVVAVVLIPFGFVVVIIGDLASIAWHSAGLIAGAMTGLVFIASPGCAIAAILTGHSARRRYPGEPFGRAGLILGYVAVGMFVALAVLMAIAWMTIRTR